MDNLEKRILEVSKMVSENLIEAMLDFRNGNQQTHSLWDAEELLTPELKRLKEQLSRVYTKGELGDELLNHARALEAETCYVIGIVAGLHLAGRSDLVPKFAEMYARTTSDRDDLQYDKIGERIVSTH